MAIFILGYANADVDLTDNGENLTLYANAKEADFETEEWVSIEADTLAEAKLKYEKTFEAWQLENGLHYTQL